MIEVSHITKHFGKTAVLNDISFTVEHTGILGLIGYNGAGKTTLLKIMNGIYRPDDGQVYMDGEPVYENPRVKEQMFLMTEEMYFLPQADLLTMERFYRGYYPKWSTPLFLRLAELLELDVHRNLSSFSKGMQRQAGLIQAFASSARCLLLDEVFDGLDLKMRRTMRQLLRLYVQDRKAAVVVTSHNLQELEILSERIAMLEGEQLVHNFSVAEFMKQGRTLEEIFLQERKEIPDEWEDLFKQGGPVA